MTVPHGRPQRRFCLFVPISVRTLSIVVDLNLHVTMDDHLIGSIAARARVLTTAIRLGRASCVNINGVVDPIGAKPTAFISATALFRVCRGTVHAAALGCLRSAHRVHDVAAAHGIRGGSHTVHGEEAA